MLNIVRDVSQETGEEFYNRIHPRPRLRTLSPLLPHVDLQPRDVVELTGGEGEGKSTFLAHLICRTVLPRSSGGQGLGAVFLDLNLNVVVADIRDMLSSMLDDALDDDTKDLVVSSSLARLTVLHAHDPEAFSAVASIIPSLLQGDRNISLVAVDALGAFFYVERARKEVVFFDGYVKTQLKSILQRTKAFDVVVAYTKQDLFKAQEVEKKTKKKRRIYPDVGLQLTIRRGDSGRGGGEEDDYRMIAVERRQDEGSNSLYKFVVPAFGRGEATLTKTTRVEKEDE